jgi:hypothetical protein
MFRRLTLAALAATSVLGVTAVPALAHGPSRPAVIAPSNNRHYHVEWRLAHWRDREFQCPIEARRFADCKRSEGFQVRVEHRRRCVEVEYRMPSWNCYRTVDCPREARRLADFLRDQGYQARVVRH